MPEPARGLAEFDRRVLEYLVTRGSSALLARRARIILSIAGDGATISMVSRETGVSLHVVTLWKRRFIEHGLAGLIAADGSAPDFEARRNSGRYRKISEALDDAMMSVAPKAV